MNHYKELVKIIMGSSLPDDMKYAAACVITSGIRQCRSNPAEFAEQFGTKGALTVGVLMDGQDMALFQYGM